MFRGLCQLEGECFALKMCDLPTGPLRQKPASQKPIRGAMLAGCFADGQVRLQLITCR